MARHARLIPLIFGRRPLVEVGAFAAAGGAADDDQIMLGVRATGEGVAALHGMFTVVSRPDTRALAPFGAMLLLYTGQADRLPELEQLPDSGVRHGVAGADLDVPHLLAATREQGVGVIESGSVGGP